MMNRQIPPWVGSLALGLSTLLASPPLQAAPLLRCALTYAGSTQLLESGPVSDPYLVESVDVGGRFRFKAVVVGSNAQPQFVKLYAYLETRLQPVLVQQVTYLPPFSMNKSLTGKQFLYAGPVERELQYECHLAEGAP
jgi:hypothetical protein